MINCLTILNYSSLCFIYTNGKVNTIIEKLTFPLYWQLVLNETELYLLFYVLSATDKSLSIRNSNNFNFLPSLLSLHLNAFILSNYYLLSVLMFYHDKSKNNFQASFYKNKILPGECFIIINIVG